MKQSLIEAPTKSFYETIKSTTSYFCFLPFDVQKNESRVHNVQITHIRVKTPECWLPR